jgi:hypothetical protein
MRHSLIPLLRTIGHQALVVVAIMALSLSLVRVSCLLDSYGGCDEGVAVEMPGCPSDHGGAGSHDADPDQCDYCHCSALTACVLPEFSSRIPQPCTDRGLLQPVSTRAPGGPVYAPDVPPDQA